MKTDEIVLVTGATAGIGRETAIGIAQTGARVVVVGRDHAKTEAVAADVKRESKNDKVDFLIADLSSQASIRALADEFKSKYDRLDVLVNNAGGLFDQRRETVDGIEWTFALNHLSYFLLTNLLLDNLRQSAPARIVNVSSAAHSFGKINFDDLEFKRKKYSSFGAYSNSKLMNVLFTNELARRLAGSNVTANSLHPGAVASNFGDNTSGILRAVVWVFKNTMAISSKKGAETSVYLAVSPEVAGVSGKYFDQKKAVNSGSSSNDEATAKQLWQASETFVKQQF